MVPQTEAGPVRSPYYSEVRMCRTWLLDSVQHRSCPDGQFEIHRGRSFLVCFVDSLVCPMRHGADFQQSVNCCSTRWVSECVYIRRGSVRFETRKSGL